MIGQYSPSGLYWFFTSWYNLYVRKVKLVPTADKTIRFHWMFSNGGGISDNYLKDFFTSLDEAGYYSVLLPYDPYIGDWMIRLTRTIDKKSSLKYMFALRTYALSPEYTAMMFNTFDELHPGLGMINVLAGDKTQMARESSLNDDLNSAIMPDSFFSDPLERIEYTKKWLEKFTNLSILKRKPEIAITGTSDQTLQNVIEYGDYAGCMIYSYLEDPQRYNIKDKKVIVVASLLLANNEQEYQAYKTELENEEHKTRHFTIFGYKEEIAKEIEKIKALGAIDIMLTKHPVMKDEAKIHDFVKEYNENYK